MSLQLQNISKSYREQVVLDDISLELQRGEIVGLVGRNGVGKSTLLKIIAGVLSDFEGVVNKDSRIGYLSEKNPLYPQMYVSEFLIWIQQLNPNKSGTNPIEAIIDKVGLREVAGKKISTLSKGYKQRVGLAAALLSDPEILILDEPINGLDPIQIAEYRGLIKSLRKNKVIILSSHLMQEIEAICDRVLLLKDGKIRDDYYIKTEKNITGNNVIVRVDQVLDINKLRSLATIKKATQIEALLYQVEGVEGEDVRPVLFDFVVAQEARILEMRSEGVGLEELFKSAR